MYVNRIAIPLIGHKANLSTVPARRVSHPDTARVGKVFLSMQIIAERENAMQESSICHGESFDTHGSVIVTRNEGIMQDSVVRLREERVRLNYTVTQVCKLVKAGDYDISEATVRRFFDGESAAEPSQHTIDIISAVLYGTSRDEFDTTQAHRYFRECAELKISMASLQQSLAQLEGLKESYEGRLRLYEEAIIYYRQHINSLMELMSKNKE